MKMFQFMAFHTKLQWVQQPLCIRFDKIDRFIRVRGG